MKTQIQSCIEELFLLNGLPYQLYLFGSRLYGTAHEKSDYDFFLIVSDAHFFHIIDHYQSISDSPCTGWNFEALLREEYQVLNYIMSSSVELNINLYSTKQFVSKLEDNWIQSLLCCCIATCDNVSSFTWSATLSPSHFSSHYFIYYPKMGRSAVAEASKHWELAKKMFSTNDASNFYRAKKYLVHSLRDLLLGMQLAKYDRITDYSIANKWYQIILEDAEITSIKTAEAKYLKVYQELKQELNSLVQPECEARKQQALQQRSKILKPSDDYVSSLIPFIHANPQTWSTLLRKKYCISSVEVASNLYFLFCDQNYSPHYSKEVVEAGHGIIIEICDSRASIISQPISFIMECTDHFAPSMAWKEGTKSYCIPTNSSLLSMFYYNGKWSCYTTSKCNVSSDFLFDLLHQKGVLLESFPTDYTFTFCILPTDVFLYGMRNNITRKEQEPSMLLPTYSISKCSKLDTIQEYSQTLNPFTFKEMIVEDRYFNRLRIIPSQSIALSQAINWMQFYSKSIKEEQFKVSKWFYEIIRSCMSDPSALILSVHQLLKDQSDLIKIFDTCIKDIEQVVTIVDRISSELRSKVMSHQFEVSPIANDKLQKKNQVAKLIEYVDPIKKERFPSANLIHVLTSMFELHQTSCKQFFQKETLKMLLPFILDTRDYTNSNPKDA